MAGEAPIRPPAVGLLLPGQGSQHPRMGQALYEAGGVFRRELDAMAEILRPLLGLSLVNLLYGTGPEDPDTLRRTEIAQPAVFSVSVALARQWQALGVPGDGLLGHSVGEYAAAHLAGVFDLEAALSLVVERGRLIGSLPAGAMLAVSQSETQVRAMLGENLALAAVNGPKQCVVSGPPDAIAELAARLAEAGQPGRLLQTSHAFHSPLLQPAADRLAEAVVRCRPKPPMARFVSNVTGTWITPEQAVDGAYWAKQMLATVRFADGLATLRAGGIRLAVECGPGQTLTALSQAGGLKALASLAHATETPAGGSHLAAATAGLWVEGVEIDWQALHPSSARRVALPLYPFERRRFRPAFRSRQATAVPLTKRQSMASWFYSPEWHPAGEGEKGAVQGPILILKDLGGVGDTLARRLKADGLAVHVAEKGRAFATAAGFRFTVREAADEDFQRVLATLPERPRRIVHLWGLDDGDPAALEESGLHTILSLAQAIGRCYPGQPLHIDMATRGAAEVTGDEDLRPELAAAVGALRVLPYEYPELSVRAIDLDHWPADTAAAALAAEMGRGGDDAVVALRGDGRWVPGVRPLALPTPDLSGNAHAALSAGAVVLITGGFGGVGRAIARDLAREPGVRLVLVGRHAPARQVEGHPPAEDERAEFIRGLEDLGATVMTAALDIADADAVAALVRQVVDRFGRVTGVIHAAGLADLSGTVQTRKRADTERVLAPKIAGTRALERALTGQPLDFLVLCSTLGSFMPAAKFGQTA